MASFLEVTVDTKAIDAALAQLKPPGLDKSVALALVDTQKNTKTRAAALISKQMAVKSGAVKDKIVLPYVRVGDYTALVRSSKRPIPLIDFPSTREVARGVYTRAWGSARTIRGAFIATMPTGHRGVYWRTSRGRLPIKQLWGPTIAGTFATPAVADLIRVTMAERIQFNLTRRITAAIRRAKR